jgi:hypothetical protein
MIVPVALEDHHRAHLAPILERIPWRDHKADVNDVALVASYGDMRRARERRFSRIILTQHGAGQSYAGDRRRATHPSYPGGEDNNEVSLFLCPNMQSANRWTEAYPQKPVRVVGCPILDTLPSKDEDEPQTVAISFHFDGFGSVPEMKSAFEHYRKALPALADSVHLIGHAHPRRTGMRPIYERMGIEWVPSFVEVCRRADLYICDNSSTIFEFAATGRPVVLLNSPEYRRNVNHGLRFWDASHVGLNVDEPDQLVPVVEYALTDPLPEDRVDALSHAYTYDRGGAKRAADAIIEWMAQEAVAA